MPSREDFWAAGLVSILFLALIALAELWRKTGSPNPEWTRKLVHFGGGAVCLMLPFLIQSHWVVLALAAGMAVLFIVGRLTGTLQSLHGVQRKGQGVEFYPLVIYVLFLLAHDQPWKYVICVLVLAIADAAAALVGSRYGRLRYEVDGNWKSLQGSAAFLGVTFVVVLIPLLLWADKSDEIPATINCVLAALLVSMLATGFEAVSQGGRDNLWVPLGTYVVLTKILRQDLAEIAMQNISFLLICLVVGLFAWRSRALNVGGMLVFTLAAYAAWSLGSFYWSMPVFLGLLVYAVAVYASRQTEIHKVRSVVKAILPPFLVLVAANAAYQFDQRLLFNYLYGPFVTGCAAVAAQSCWVLILNHRQLSPTGRQTGVFLLALICTTAIVWPPSLVISGATFAAVVYAGVTCTGVALLFNFAVGREVPHLANPRWHTIRFVLSTVAMFIVAGLQSALLCPVWKVW